MKSIYRIISIILLSLFFQSQTTIEKGTNEISRTDEKKLISYSGDNTIKIWDLEKKKLFKSLEDTSSVKGIYLLMNG